MVRNDSSYVYYLHRKDSEQKGIVNRCNRVDTTLMVILKQWFESSRGVPHFAGRRSDPLATLQADRLLRSALGGTRNDLLDFSEGIYGTR